MTYNWKNRPRAQLDGKMDANSIQQWLEGFEKDIPFKLDNLATFLYEQIHEWMLRDHKKPLSTTWIRELVQRWADKEIFGR